MQRYLRLWALIPVAVLIIAPPAYLPRAARAEATRTPASDTAWQATAIRLPADSGQKCIDATQPHRLLVAEPGTGTVAYDWESGQRSVVNPRSFTVCGPQGWLFAPDGSGSGGWRFSLDDPLGRSVARLPTNLGRDGSAQVYARDGARLWSSPDAGLTWAAYPLPEPNARDEGFVVASADARVLHRLVYDSKTYTETHYYSRDAGQHWTVMNSGQWRMHPRASTMSALPGDIAPVTATLGTGDLGVVGQHWGSSAYVRGTDASAVREHEKGTAEFVHTQEGVLQFTQGLEKAWSFSNSAPELSLVTPAKSSRSILPLPFPVPAQPHTSTVRLDVVPFAPFNVFMRREQRLYYSPNGGRVWRELPDAPGGSFLMTPYLPLTLVAIKDRVLYTLSLPEATQKLTTRAVQTGATGSRFFAETGHNLAWPFHTYWEAHGGLAQLGLPLTEAVPQVSAVDGRIYRIQYFERAVLEYHPENKAPYDVLQSLLGVGAYRARYGATGAPNQHPATENARFFPESGHTLGGRLRAYWESHGGLPQQGYPISGEFTEVSELNGKPYIVQYFERAVFEYHPENQPPYDVLLSQLGRAETQTLDTGPHLRCEDMLDPRLHDAWGSAPQIATQLGCPGTVGEGPTAFERFEHGAMLWSGTGNTTKAQILVLYDDGHYKQFEDLYNGPRAWRDCDLKPPSGRFAPQRGFQQVWCENKDVRQALGWALEPEKGGAGLVQVFEHGAVYATAASGQPIAVFPAATGSRQPARWTTLATSGGSQP